MSDDPKQCYLCSSPGNLVDVRGVVECRDKRECVLRYKRKRRQSSDSQG